MADNSVGSLLKMILKLLDIGNAGEEGGANADLLNEIKTQFTEMNEEAREQVLSLIESCFENEYRLLCVLLTIFADVFKSEKLLNRIINAAIRADFSIDELQEILIQIIYQDATGETADRESMFHFYYYVLERCRDELNLLYEYIQYDKRCHNRIVLVTDQVLGENHSPTQLLICIYSYLEQLGYDVQVLVCSTQRIITRGELWLSERIVMNNMFSESSDFAVKILGQRIKGYDHEFSPGRVLDDLRSCTEYIYRWNPEFVMGIGGTNLVCDLASSFTTTVCQTLTLGIPVSVSKYIVYQTRIDRSDERYYYDHIQPVVIENNIFRDTTKDSERLISDSQPELTGLKIAIVGNRLNDEISSDFHEFLDKLIETVPDLTYVIVGNCDKFRSVVKKSSHAGHYVFLGYVEDLESTLERCDLFLNPPRNGGGFSAKIALKKRVPILTLPDCDVALWAGEDFTYENLSQISNVIERYYLDCSFTNEQKNKCIERYNDICPSPEKSLENMKRMIEIVVNDVQKIRR